MPPPDRMLNTLRRAIDLGKTTPGRRGHLVHLQNCTEVLVTHVGDSGAAAGRARAGRSAGS